MVIHYINKLNDLLKKEYLNTMGYIIYSIMELYKTKTQVKDQISNNVIILVHIIR